MTTRFGVWVGTCSILLASACGGGSLADGGIPDGALPGDGGLLRDAGRDAIVLAVPDGGYPDGGADEADGGPDAAVLLPGDAGDDVDPDSGTVVADGGADAGNVVIDIDGGPDAGPVVIPADAGPDAGPDSGPDAGPPIVVDAGPLCATPCDDGNFCNGIEGCVNGVCQLVESTSCDDGIACTADSCAPATGCSNTPIDSDGDGSGDCADCDDGNDDIYPGAPELCNSRDDDCDDSTDEGAGLQLYPDCDGDGWASDQTGPYVGGCTAPAPDDTGCATPVQQWVARVPTPTDFDCDDLNDDVHSNIVPALFSADALQVWFPPYDYDCDGDEEAEFATAGGCAVVGGVCTPTLGWETTTPFCGDSATFIASCDAGCAALTETRVQRCR